MLTTLLWPLAQTCQKYWVGKPKYWGQKVVKSDKCMYVSQLLGGTCPGCPPKSMPMIVALVNHCFILTVQQHMHIIFCGTNHTTSVTNYLYLGLAHKGNIYKDLYFVPFFSFEPTPTHLCGRTFIRCIDKQSYNSYLVAQQQGVEQVQGTWASTVRGPRPWS